MSLYDRLAFRADIDAEAHGPTDTAALPDRIARPTPQLADHLSLRSLSRRRGQVPAFQRKSLPTLSAAASTASPSPRSRASRPVNPSSSPCGCIKKR